jgi:hypothetical protein
MTSAQATKFVTALDGLLRSLLNGDGGAEYASKCRREMVEALTTPSDPTHEPAPVESATAHGYIFAAAAYVQRAAGCLDSAVQLHGGPYVIAIGSYEDSLDKLSGLLNDLGKRVVEDR